MLETSQPSISKVDRNNTPTSNDDNDIEMESMESMDANVDTTSLWNIEDDSMFYPLGLKHHSAGKGKSVYVTWNENYLLNFVFKTSSRTGTTTLTKVRITMPLHNLELENIVNILILEMNTLIYMKSGRVYYFSSVKSMHKVDWLTGVRCMTTCPVAQFSVIRLEHQKDQKRKLNLEVYKDVPQLGKCSINNVLSHSYDISFDLENLFNCEWLDETYSLISLIMDKKNETFLKQLVSIGDIFRPEEDLIDIENNQEVHIFTISGNIFVLVGVHVSESEPKPPNSQQDNYSIRLLNTYACPIECIRVDCENSLLIVLLQSGHMDIWYKSESRFDAVFHCLHEVTYFLDYDYLPSENMFFFTTPEEVIQLNIIMQKNSGVENECFVREIRKYIGGMIACTWVEGLKQLICLSFNNIFYRINFATEPDNLSNTNDTETDYENLNKLYALNSKRVYELTAKSKVVNELMEQPRSLHDAIEKEFQKQQILALSSKMDIFKKLFQCHLEYHVNIPGIEYFEPECVKIQATNHHSQQVNSQSLYCLIYLSLKNNKSTFLSSVFTATMWFLNISSEEQNLQLYIPYDLLNKKLCFIFDFPVKQQVNFRLPNYSLSLLTFFSHQTNFICLNFNLSSNLNEKTYLNLFSHIQNLPIFRNSLCEIKNLLKQHLKSANLLNDLMARSENDFKIKQNFKIAKNVLQNLLEKLKANSTWLSNKNLKLYYLYQYLIELNYDNVKEILQIKSNYSVAIFYIKLLLIHAAMESYNDITIIHSPVQNMQQMLMQYQNDIEHLYGCLLSSESNTASSKTISMHFENLQNVYLKLRNEFYEIFR